MKTSYTHPRSRFLYSFGWLFCGLAAFSFPLPLRVQDQPALQGEFDSETKLTRPKITGIAHVRAYATQLEDSSAFLTKMLGLPS
jgi:hypothetical protein